MSLYPRFKYSAAQNILGSHIHYIFVFLVFVKAIDAAAAACRLSPEFESAIGLFLDVHFS